MTSSDCSSDSCRSIASSTSHTYSNPPLPHHPPSPSGPTRNFATDPLPSPSTSHPPSLPLPSQPPSPQPVPPISQHLSPLASSQPPSHDISSHSLSTSYQSSRLPSHSATTSSTSFIPPIKRPHTHLDHTHSPSHTTAIDYASPTHGHYSPPSLISHPQTSLSSNYSQDSLIDNGEADDDEGSYEEDEGDDDDDSDDWLEEIAAAGMDRGVVAREAKRLSEVIQACMVGGMSSRGIELVLKAKPLSCKCSYQSIRKWTLGRAGVTKERHWMCPDGHMVVENESDRCKAPGCLKPSMRSIVFWRLPLVDQLRALLMDPDSFHQIQRGQERALLATTNAPGEVLSDYYDGRLFRRRYGDVLVNASRMGEVLVLLRMTTDGFKLFEGRRKQRTAWPVAFAVLNYDHRARFRSSNVLITSFVPGSHDSDHFDTFLRPTIQEMLELERGVMATWPYGRWRLGDMRRSFELTVVSSQLVIIRETSISE